MNFKNTILIIITIFLSACSTGPRSCPEGYYLWEQYWSRHCEKKHLTSEEKKRFYKMVREGGNKELLKIRHPKYFKFE